MIRQAQMKAYLNQQQEIRHQQEVIAKLKSFNREKSIKRAESREKMLAKVEVLEKPTEVNDAMSITLEPRSESGNDVLTIRNLGKAFGSLNLFQHVDIDIRRGERIAVIGNNGAGKSTLLKIIMGMLPADAGEIRPGARVHVGYYDQEQQVLHPEKTIFEEIQDAYPDMDNTRVRSVLAAFLFTGDDVFKKISDLSGGERGRVSLAKLMLSEANFLILDEPTNHLDITSKEILEDALNHYTGTVLYVSHDRYFINKTATRILELTGQTFINYIGNYDYYLEKKEELTRIYTGQTGSASSLSSKTAGPLAGLTAGSVSSSSLSEKEESAGKQDWKAQKEEQARLRKRQNDLKKTEEAILNHETRMEEIDQLLASEEVYTNVSRLMELNQEKETLTRQLEELYEAWESLAE